MRSFARPPLLALLLIFVTVAIACFAKPAARTANDIARQACSTFAEARERQLGISAEQWCRLRDNLDPFLQVILSAERKAGISSAPKAPNESNDDPSSRAPTRPMLDDMALSYSLKLALAGRGHGYLLDKVDSRDLIYAAPSLEQLVRPTNHSLEPHAVARLDQGAANTCVPHGFAHAIAIVENLAGLEYEPLSLLSMYATARAYHGGQRIDAGTYPRTMAKALAKIGVPHATVWPYDLRNINRNPPPQAYLEGHARRGGSYRRITATGQGRIDAVCAALADGKPVVIGSLVDRDFQQLKGRRLIHRPSLDTIVGGHLWTLIGYQQHGARFESLNSYGRAWRDDGIAELTADYLVWEHTQDLVIIDGWERLRLRIA